MRPAAICLLLVAFAGGAACAGCARSDPDLAKPCAERRTAKVFMGIGQYTYVPLGTDQGPLIDTDLEHQVSVRPGVTEQGDFVWLGIGCQGLGPDVTLSYGIRDAATGVDLSLTSDQRVLLTYNSSTNQDEAPGLSAYFQLPAAGSAFTTSKQLVGDAVTVWADVTDTCHPDPANPVHGEKPTRLEGFDPSTCVGCLDQACHAELAACDAECHAIQGCLDAYCVHLSALGSPDEALCQAFCQGQHPTGKAAHVAVVACVQDPARGATCSTQACVPNPVDGGSPAQLCYIQPPCYPYSIDYRHCVNLQDDPAGGPCSALLQTCNNLPSGECLAYKTCTSTCTTWAACQACAAKYPKGEDPYEKHQACIEIICLAQAWIPHSF